MENEIKDTKSEEENSAELTPTAAETTDPSADSAGQTEPADPQKPKKAKKKKKKSGWFYKVTIVLLIAIMAFSAYKIITILYEYHVGTSEYEQVQEIAGTQSADKAKTYSGKVNFAALQKKYKNVKAWLYSKDTPINYPVAQSNDNQYYLYRMINGDWNGKGTLFIDYRCEKPFNEFNTIIYGHRMRDGSMFHSLIYYRKTSYFNKHKKLVLTTPDAVYDVYVFGVVTIPASSDKYKYSFSGESDKQAYLDWIKSKSEIDTGVSVTTDDKIVMLSTCTYEFDNARLVVYGKLVKRSDSSNKSTSDSSSDTSGSEASSCTPAYG